MYENDPTSEKSYTAKEISNALKDIEFPISKQDLIQEYGDREVELINGDHLKLKVLLDDIPDESFSTSDNIQQAYESKFTEGTM